VFCARTPAPSKKTGLYIWKLKPSHDYVNHEASNDEISWNKVGQDAVCAELLVSILHVTPVVSLCLQQLGL
jgi:hypothetical protein